MHFDSHSTCVSTVIFAFCHLHSQCVSVPLAATQAPHQIRAHVTYLTSTPSSSKYFNIAHCKHLRHSLPVLSHASTDFHSIIPHGMWPDALVKFRTPCTLCHVPEHVLSVQKHLRLQCRPMLTRPCKLWWPLHFIPHHRRRVCVCVCV